MIQKLSNGFKEIMIETIDKLKSSDKRIALAKIAKTYGDGGQTAVAETFHVSRDTIRKGSYELESGFPITDAFQARGRKKVEKDHLPHLLEDIQAIVDGQSQTDPSFNTTQLYTRMTIQEVRDQLVLQKGYQDADLPTNQTLNTKLHQLGYHLKKVQKTKPVKKIEETDAIFENLHATHEAYQGESNAVRLSFDTKDRVKIGPFSRGGKSRVRVEAADHDFGQTFLSLFGILDMSNEHVELTFTASKVTADLIADQIEAYVHKLRSQQEVDTLIINADNGPENNSRRTQFMKRMIEFAATYDIKVILAYYPPYHSKYNPIERGGQCLSNIGTGPF
nr:ISAzo13 family transposase [Salicibibacter cibarius]